MAVFLELRASKRKRQIRALNERRDGSGCSSSDDEDENIFDFDFRDYSDFPSSPKRRASLDNAGKPKVLKTIEPPRHRRFNTFSGKTAQSHVQTNSVELHCLQQQTVSNAKKTLVPPRVIERSQPARDLSRTDDTVVVRDTCSLKRIQDPLARRQNLLEDIQSSDWEKQYNCVESIRCLVAHHQYCIDDDLGIFIPFLRNEVKGLRSAAVKNALLAVKELFIAFGTKALCFQGKLLVKSLMEVASGDKAFLRKAAADSLESMVKYASSEKSLVFVLSFSRHPRAKLVACAAEYASKIIASMSKRATLNIRRQNVVLECLLGMSNAKLSQTRIHSRCGIKGIAKAMGKGDFATLVKKNFYGRDAITLLSAQNC